ncbi:hypothetical protein PJL70_29845, partial [Mycobacterium kansasii]
PPPPASTRAMAAHAVVLRVWCSVVCFAGLGWGGSGGAGGAGGVAGGAGEEIGRASCSDIG